jgi:hypothetical protein
MMRGVEVEETDWDGRSSHRKKVDLVAYVRTSSDQIHEGEVHDLSEDGCKISGLQVLDPGREIWLKVFGITPRLARIVWSEPGAAGCKFVSPIDPLLVEELARRKPSSVASRVAAR